MTHYIPLRVVAILLMYLFLVGCASVENRRDPLESMNRSIFEFNEVLDDNVIEPVAKGYKFITPDPIEQGVTNFFSNMNDVVVITNSLLQLDFMGTVGSGARLIINSTVGIGGLIDVASEINSIGGLSITKRNEDFGQTLGHYGVSSGPYLVLPLLGPSSVRDAVGRGVDSLIMHPITNVFWTEQLLGFYDIEVQLPLSALKAVDERVQFLDAEKTLEEAALDKYEFIRDAYLQRRESQVYNGNVPEQVDYEYDEE